MRPAIVILAGGQGRRMGGADKALLPFGAGTLLDQVLARMRAQGSACALSANGDPARFGRFGVPVLPDPLAGQPGPLAGVLAGMEWTEAADIVTVPVDGPFVPLNLVARLLAGRGDAEIVQAVSEGRVHPVFALWPTRLAPELRAALLAGQRTVGQWAARFRLARVEFAGEPFVNVNTEEQLREAREGLLF